MNQSFYAAAVAASQQQQRLTVTANNLANINTIGFKASQANFSDLLYNNWFGPDGVNLPRGTGSRIIQTSTNFESGSMQYRNDGQNYAISGRGFFALRNPQTNEVFYSRAGSFHWGSMDVDGALEYYLLDSDSFFVLDQNQQPIRMTADDDAEYPVGVFDFANTDGMLHFGTNKLQPLPKNGGALPAEGQAVHGMVEESNADVAEEFSYIVEIQRSFSYALKVVQTQDEIETTINGLRN